MKIWCISDTHFGHDKMPQYCGRPIGFEKLIFDNLLRVVKKSDMLIHLGDFCIGDDEMWHKRFLTEIDCKKILVRGNHDHKSNSWYLKMGWDFVCFAFSNTYFGKKILFSHCPQPINDVDFNIHGHFHNSLPRLLKKEWVTPDEEYRNKHDLSILTPKHKLLALEYTNYQPVLLETFIK